MHAVFSLESKRTHCWRSNLLIGCIWSLLACTLPQLVADELSVLSSGLERHLFLVTQACEMSIFVTRFTLKLLGRTLETFHMFEIPTPGTSISTYMGLVRIKCLVAWHLSVTCIPLVTGWS